VEDCVDAILKVAITPEARGEIFNVGSDIPVSFLELVKTIIRVTGRGQWQYAEFSPERKAQEPGDFYSDISKINACTGWKPATSLDEGLAKTIAFYTAHGAEYWESDHHANLSAAKAIVEPSPLPVGKS
jgi:nucleoside-diphosphate-sugar epimerase